MSELLGADRLIAKCRKLASKQIGDDIVRHAVLYACQNVVQADAKLRAPANEGELRNSIKVRVKVEGDRVFGEVFTNLEHGVYVELGTGPKGQANHAGISPDVNVSYRSTPWYVHEDQIEVGRYHFQKMGEFYKMDGQAAQPYLYPALKENHDRISNNISKYVSRKLKEQIR